ncbi:hypothetical protein [Phenylobacterium kunshanense]|uniref:hypothetical protein n=1 Tax=Phenylobacterium kunshanense TaxID=1445034 RepID=UPI001403EB4E|nr:hypothetical protein [Phenylobacterium kunshanense]
MADPLQKYLRFVINISSRRGRPPLTGGNSVTPDGPMIRRKTGLRQQNNAREGVPDL